jgi:hypothetical protein
MNKRKLVCQDFSYFLTSKEMPGKKLDTRRKTAGKTDME